MTFLIILISSLTKNVNKEITFGCKTELTEDSNMNYIDQEVSRHLVFSYKAQSTD